MSQRFIRRSLAAYTLLVFGATASLVAQNPTPAAPAAPPTVDPATFPAVVAVVNGAEITRDELVRAVAMLQGTPPPGQSRPALPKAAYAQLLDQLIGAELMYQEAVKKGLAATDEEVQAEFDRAAKRYPDAQAFEKALAQDGLTRELLRAEIKETVTIRKLVEKEVAPTVGFDEAEVKAYYDANLQQFSHPDQFKVAHILIGVPKDATAEQKAAARKKAEELLAEVKGGADFAALAKEHSTDRGSNTRGGELPWVGYGDTVEPFDKVARELTAGQLSSVVETPFGFHIIKGVDKRAAGPIPFEQVKDRIAQGLAGRKVAGGVVGYAQRLREAGKVEVKL
jgi:parvulin-like peptidyl-prolyl isomerase